MFPEFRQFLVTIHDRVILLDEIKVLHDSLFQADGAVFATALQTKVRQTVAPIFEKNFPPVLDSAKRLEEFSKWLHKLSVLRMTVARDFSRSQLEEIMTKLEENASGADPILLDVHIDLLLIGGAIIDWNGKYEDQSIRTKLDEFWESYR